MKLADGITLALPVRYAGEVDGQHEWVANAEGLSAPPVRMWADKLEGRSTLRVTGMTDPTMRFSVAEGGTSPSVLLRHGWDRMADVFRSWFRG